MWKTVVRRILIMIPQIIILSVLIFMIAKMMPGDPFTGMIDPNTDPAQIAALRAKMGLDDPWWQQYVRWVQNVFHGDFGQSFTFKVPVTQLLGERVGNTIWLSILSLTLTYALALPLGLLAGRYNNSNLDRVVTFYNYLSYSIPTFVLALLFLWIFGYNFGWFPTGGSVDLNVVPGTLQYLGNRIYHMLLPAITYALLGTTGIIQYLRSEVIDAKQEDYVKTARSKGVPVEKVYTKHIFRNAILPVASSFGYEITGLIGGSVFIEQIFAYPGMGQLFIQSITSRDYSVVLAVMLLSGIAVLFGTLLSDIILSIVDPRIRIE
ncbi:MAG: ABC transporter permease [Aerococcus sp.]|nr:ABC transporter permease [Aerococcus sp.]